MFEVYTGTKAGRPTVLLLLTAGVLVGALGLAWTQVHGTRALGDPVGIEGTPLIVRPPKGWAQHPDYPGLFVRKVRSERWGRRHEPIERKIEFRYQRWRVFQPLPYLLRLSNYRDIADAYEPEAAQIGGLAGVQVRRERRFEWLGRLQFGESIYRLASTARGDQISVEYTPLGGLSPGDLELFEAVCRAVVLDDPAVEVDPEEALVRAGVQFPVAENWKIVGPDFPEIAGLYVQNHEGGIPVWALGVFRTWLAAGRRPADLLTSFAELYPPPFSPPAQPRQWSRPDGVTVAAIQRPPFEEGRGQVASAWVVAKSPSEVVLIFALGDGRGGPLADQAAAQLVKEIEFLTSYPSAGVEAAEANGRQLATLLRASGAARWWGAGEDTSYYYGEILGQRLLVISQREAVGGDPADGYRGFDRYVVPGGADYQHRSWEVDGRADAYGYRVESDFDRRGRATSVRSQEFRDAGGSSIRRTAGTGSRSGVLQIPVGAAFVCPPVETLAQGWAGQQEEGQWLIEVSPLSGSTTTTQLLTPLGPDPDGRRQVLVVEDYWPRGTILAFDSDLEMAWQRAPVGRFDCVTAEQARRILRTPGRR